VLRAAQNETLGDVAKQAKWHDSVASLPRLPSIVIANEFFDALPIRQFEQHGDTVSERCVGVDEHGNLAIGLVASQQHNPFAADGVFEHSPARHAIAMALGHLIESQRGAALVIDYGHRKSAIGDTLQAMKSHQFCSILESPGHVDLTSHVDFEKTATAFAAAGAKALSLLTQGEFLKQMGLIARTEALARKIEGKNREDFLESSRRLAHDDAMGTLFKVLAVTDRNLPAPFPFGE
jgi:SAM-dependent MidA family methyltransferase